MKKIVLMTLFLAILGICKVNAQNKYTVTVNVQVTYVYYTDQYYTDEAFETDMDGQSQTFIVCADTPNEAEDEAKSECSTVCNKSMGRKLGSQVLNGQTYYVKEFRKVYSATATKVGTC